MPLGRVIGQCVWVTEKPWWRRLDGYPPDPRWWNDSLLFRSGFLGTVIFGGGALLRLAFPEKLGYAWLYAAPALVSIVVLIVSIRRSDAPRS